MNRPAVLMLARKWANKHPELAGRLTRAVDLVGKVERPGARAHIFYVQGGERYRICVNPTTHKSSCTCPDSRNGNHCKHRLAVALYVEALPLRIAFDIGGVLSKRPDVFRPMVAALQAGGARVYVITDMHEHAQSVRFVRENGYDIPPNRILNADYDTYGEHCKAEVVKEHAIDVLVDDFPGYVAADSPAVKLFVWPDPSQPYYADDFVTDGSEGNFGRRRKPKQAGP